MSAVSMSASEPSGPDPIALVTAAAKKSAVIWVSAGSCPPRALWQVASDDCMLVVIGGTEQEMPELVGATAATVTLRSKENGAAVVVTDVEVQHLAPESEEWKAAVAELAPKRLNAPAGDTAAAWARDSQVLRLRPTSVRAAAGEFATVSAPLTDSGSYETLRTSPAGTGRPLPYHLGKRTRRRQGK